MSKRCVLYKRQADNGLAKKGEGWHSISGRQPVFDYVVSGIGIRTYYFLISLEILFCLVEV